MLKILFSAVGGTDPISGYHDGALVHIARVYKPDVIYLYMSGEICELSNQDNRYLYCLDQLKKMNNQNFEVIQIMRADLFDVHIFDTFLVEFEKIITSIQRKYNEVDLLVNVSSGTPAMKSAMQVLAAMSEKRITPIQVTTPAKQINHREDIKKDYAVELQWELNFDNQEKFENRCQVSSNINMACKIKSEIIKKHIDVYDYIAAGQVAKSMVDYVHPTVIKLIDAGSSRLKLDQASCAKFCKEVDYDAFPIKSSDERGIFEYLLLLKIKIQKEEYADFLKGITPIFFELLIRLIEKKLNFNLSQYYNTVNSANNTIARRWNENVNFNSQLLEVVGDVGDKKAVIYSWQLVKIIDKQTGDIKIKGLVDRIRDVEEKIRNPVAHNITYVTDEVIKKYTGLYAREIFIQLKDLAVIAGIKIKSEDLASYDKLNEEIKKYLED